MLTNIGPIPVQAGDVVRDQQDGVDYVVRAAAIAGAGALVVYGISLYDQSLKQWTADTYEELGLRRVLNNHRGEAPEAMAERLTDLFQKPGRIARTAGKADFFDSLFSENGQFFRDLLMIGDEVEQFNPALGKMAAALVDVSHRIWTADEIYEALASSVHPEAFDEELLQQFSQEFAFRIRATASLKTSTVRPNMPGGPSLLRDLMLPQVLDEQEINWGGSALQQLQYSVRRKGQKALGPEARKLVSRAINPEIGDPILGFLGVSSNASASDRLTALIARVLETRGARESTTVVQSFMASLVRADAKKIAEGKAPSATLAHILDEKAVGAALTHLAGAQKIPRRRKNRTPRLTLVDREIEGLRVSPYKVSHGQFMSRHQATGAEQFYSIDANDFFHHYLNGQKVRVGQRTFDLNSLSEKEAASKAIFGGEQTIMGSSRHFIQAIRALGNNETADLTHLVSESQQLRRRLPTHVLSKIDLMHFSKQGRDVRGRGTVGFRFNTSEFTPRLLKALKAAQLESSLVYKKEVVDELVQQVPGHKRLFIAQTMGGRIEAHDNLEILDRLMAGDAEKQATTYYYAHLQQEKAYQYLTGQLDLRNLLSSGQAEPILPFGDEGMIGTFRQQFASLDTGVVDPTVRIMETVEGVTGAVDFQFRHGYQHGKMAFVSIKNIDGTGGIRVVGTDLGSSGDAIQQQLNRADMLLDPDSTVRFLDQYGNSLHRKPNIGFLDLETDPGSKRLKEISIASTEDLQQLMELTDPMADDFRHMTAKQARTKVVELTRTHGIGDDLLFKTVDKRASMGTRLKNLERTLDRLESFDQVWAQSKNDYRFLLDEVDSIFRSGKLSKDSYEQLTRRILDISETRGVTAETIPQLTGHLVLGNSSQPLATAKYLGHQEFHVALLDNLDAYKLQTQVYRDDYLRVRRGMEVIDLGNNPMTVVFRNSRLSDIDHQKIRISKIEYPGEGVVQLTYNNALGHQRMMTGNAAQIGRAFGELAEQPLYQTFEEFMDHKLSGQIAAQAARNLEDRVRRLANEMNPLAEYIMDVGQRSGLKGPAIVQPRGAKVFRARYIASKVYAEFVEGVGRNQTTDKIEEAAIRFVGDNENFKALMSRYGIKHSMSDELFDSTREDVAATLSSMSDAGEAPAIMEFFRRLGGAGDRLMGVTLDESQLDKFDATVLHLFEGVEKHTVKAQEGVHFSLRMPDIHNKMRAKTLITEAMDRDPSQAVNQFVSELISYASLEPSSKAGIAAREALESAGVRGLEEMLEGVKSHATRNGWRKNARRYLLGQDFANHMTFGLSEDFTAVAGEAGSQFLRGYGGLADIFARTFDDRAEQLLDANEKKRVQELAGSIRGRIARIQAELSEGDRDISVFMGQAVREEVGRFLNDGDVKSNLALLTPDIEILDVVGKIADEATVQHAIRTVDKEFDNPDAMDLLNAALKQDSVEAAVRKLRQQAEADVHQEAVAKSTNLSVAAEQVVKGATMEGALEAATPATKNAEVEIVHRAVNKAMPGVEKEGLMEAIHGLTLGVDPLRNGRLISGITKPLMAIAGAVALLTAVNPAIDANYTGGLRSKQRGNINDPVNRFSEIPGAGSTMGPVFVGQEQPFKLDINVRGLAANETQKKLLIDRVYDSLTESTEYMSQRNTIRERRMESFRHPAAELLKANL